MQFALASVFGKVAGENLEEGKMMVYQLETPLHTENIAEKYLATTGNPQQLPKDAIILSIIVVGQRARPVHIYWVPGRSRRLGVQTLSSVMC